MSDAPPSDPQHAAVVLEVQERGKRRGRLSVVDGDRDQQPPPEPWQPAQHPDSDLANAYRLKSMAGDRLAHVEGVGWLEYSDQTAWRADQDAPLRLAHGLSVQVLREVEAHAGYAASCGSPEDRRHHEALAKSLLTWAPKCESAGRMTAAVSLAQPLMALDAALLDAQPNLLGVQGGVINLDDLTFRPHRPEDYTTRLMGCQFDQRATCESFVNFLCEVLPDSEVAQFLQRCIGYALTGRRGENIALFLLGSGANGKSVFLNAMGALFGDLGVIAPSDLLAHKPPGSHPAEFAVLRGRRLALVSEPRDGRLSEDTFKRLVGGERITARQMHRDWIEFDQTALLMVALNHRLRAMDASEALWRRIREVPFTVTIPAERRDPELADRLKAELPGILNWALAGLREYRQHRLSPPAAVSAATADYRRETDVIGSFVEEECDRGEYRTAVKNLYRRFSAWAQDTGETRWSQKVFSQRLAAGGFLPVRTSAERQFSGLRLRPRPESE